MCIAYAGMKEEAATQTIRIDLDVHMAKAGSGLHQHRYRKDFGDWRVAKWMAWGYGEDGIAIALYSLCKQMVCQWIVALVFGE